MLVAEVEKDVYQIKGDKPSSHVYLVKSRLKNVLIDSGVNASFGKLKKSLEYLGLQPSDIHLLLNTHEHFDHIGGNWFFAKTAIVAAHRLAATKIERQDEYVTMYNRCDGCLVKENCDLQNLRERYRLITPHLWLEDKTFLDLGDFHLQIIHTPGHTSGSISIYEQNRKVLFSGDTVFSSGTLPAIAPSGSAGDFINSLQQLSTKKIALILPGHGGISDQPDEDLAATLDFAKAKMKEARTLGGVDTWTESVPLEAFLSKRLNEVV